MDETFDREGFVIYKHLCLTVCKMSDEEIGQWFRAIVEFQIDKCIPENLDPKIDLLFDLFKRQFEKDDKKYQKRVNANRRNAQKNKKNKGHNYEWSPMESSGKVGNQSQPIVTDKDKDKGKDKGKDKDKDKEKDKDNTLDIMMGNSRRLAKNVSQSTVKKEDLIDLWENIYSESWKDDSKIREMYENKISEFEN